MVVLTNHFIERYGERVGRASPQAQRKWLHQSLNKHTTRRQDDGRYSLKLVGSHHVAVLSREHSTWVALTIK
ncbi:hypothetical protein JCM15765_02420 [Paradesulfitobacterium aromaticivorans]